MNGRTKREKVHEQIDNLKAHVAELECIVSVYPDARWQPIRGATATDPGVVSEAAIPERLTLLRLGDRGAAFVTCAAVDVGGGQMSAVVHPAAVAVPWNVVIARLRLHHPDAYADLVSVVDKTGHVLDRLLAEGVVRLRDDGWGPGHVSAGRVLPRLTPDDEAVAREVLDLFEGKEPTEPT